MSIDFSKIPTPCYVCDESLLQHNLDILDKVQRESGAKILVALKGYALWDTFPQIAKVLHGVSASGLWEAQLGRETMNKAVHTSGPAYRDDEIEPLLALSDHLVFNSFQQWQRFKPAVVRSHKSVACGIRINPNYSEVSPLIYNPCAPFSRLGVTLDQFRPDLLDGITGLHFHTHCEQNSDALERTLAIIETQFGQFIQQMQWVNFGGGHHITRQDYDVARLIRLIKAFKQRYDVEVYLEPGEAIGWQTGVLVGCVLDIIHNGMDIAILDVSAANHMPDCLEMPYRPTVRGAGHPNELAYTYRLGAPTCLAGDVIGDYSFSQPLHLGDKIIFEDMIHYTFVKNNTFNGIRLPSLGLWTQDNQFKLVRQFDYHDYKNRLGRVIKPNHP